MTHSTYGTESRRGWRKDESADLTRYLVTFLNPGSAASEAYRSLRANLLYTVADEPSKVIVLTSPGPGEGKSTTCANLGVVLAQAGKSTLILDCDLRKPAIHKFFELPNRWGVTNVVVGERSLKEVWEEPVEGLKVVCVGSVPPNPAELLGSQNFSEFLASVREEFDYVLVDASPVELVSDPAILAAQGDGVLLVLDAQKTRKGYLRRSISRLEAVGANVLGTVMTRSRFEGDYYY